MSLIKSEREVVLHIADDERSWTIFCDSRRFGNKLRKIAARWGVEPQKVGNGFELTLPLKAVRFGGPRAPRSESKSGQESTRKTGYFGRRAKSPS